MFEANIKELFVTMVPNKLPTVTEYSIFSKELNPFQLQGWDRKVVNKVINLWNSLYGNSALNRQLVSSTLKWNYYDPLLYNYVKMIYTTGEGN